MSPKPDERPLPRLVLLFWSVVLTVHAVAAGAWVWLMPGGFPIGHARFWANRALPALAVGVALTGLASIWLRRWVVLRLAIVPLPVGWLVAGIAARVIFPESMRSLWILPAGAGVVLGVGAWLSCRGRRLPRGAAALAAVVAVAVGAAAPLTQRAGPPSTRPLDVAMPEPGSLVDVRDFAAPVTLGERLEVLPAEGAVRLTCGGVRLRVSPLLTFDVRSPDRCWTLLVPPPEWVGPPRRITGMRLEEGRVALAGMGSEPAIVELSSAGAEGGVAVEAFTRLDQPVYSHLNTFCEIGVAGHKRLALSFSPCPDAQTDVLPFDYPVGRPRRLAFVDAGGRFHIVEASSGEKGPFRELAAGPLRRGEPLVITLCDEGRAVCRVVLDDWAAQAGTALSPTAGWGLPVNAIEFSLEGDAPGSEAAIFITLAGTSVGRGWDTVGHAAGTYRNRMRIEPVPATRGGERLMR